MTRALQINPAIDPGLARPAFQKAGRIQLPAFLAPADGRAVGAALMGPDLPWSRSILFNGKGYDAPADVFETLPQEQRSMLEAAVMEGARTSFQYQFDNWRVSEEVEAGRRRGGPVSPVEAVYDLLNGEPFLDFVRTLTGEPRCAYADVQATRYRPGDFLTAHDDEAEGKNRLFAYVMNFTPQWRADWGGLLLFLDGDGNVSGGYTPTFNALNLFQVPQPHTVTSVAPFAGANRFSITGWIRAR